MLITTTAGSSATEPPARRDVGFESLLTKMDVVRILCASPRSVDTCNTLVLLRATKPGGRLVRIDPADLRDFLARARLAARAGEGGRA